MSNETEQPSLARSLKTFHDDEDGLEALQVVMIVGVAAVVLLFLYKLVWPKVKNWVTTKTDEVIEQE